MLFLSYSNEMDHLVHPFINGYIIFSQNDQLNINQSGFRSKNSTETALLSVTVALQIAKADTKSSVLILQDLSANFNNVNHQILLSTITGSALHWFEYYRTGTSGANKYLIHCRFKKKKKSRRSHCMIFK